MKSVLISIQPKWCELITSGKKTVEVRKTAPKEVPFKVYIYQTKKRWIYKILPWLKERHKKVIGEFVCDKVEKYTFSNYEAEYRITDVELIATCLNHPELITYGKGKPLYGLHISDLKIYDKPKELSEFHTICNKYESDSCEDCPYLEVERCSYPCDDSVDTWCSVDNIKPIARPPQSWCYIEEVEE